jgi:hypothetical protein
MKSGAVMFGHKSTDETVSKFIKCTRSFGLTDISEIRDDVVVAAITKRGNELRSFNVTEHNLYMMCEKRGISPQALFTKGCEERIVIETQRTFPLDQVELDVDTLKEILKQTIDIIVGLDKLGMYYSDCRVSGFRYVRSSPPKIVITNMTDMTVTETSRLKNMLKTFFISLGFESTSDSPKHLGIMELEQMVKTLIDMPDEIRPYSCDTIRMIVQEW